MIHRIPLAAILVFSAIPALAVDDKDAAKKDLDALQGTWLMVSGAASGNKIPDEMLKNFKRVCKDDEITVTNGEQLIIKAHIKLDASKKPKTIDYDVSDGPTKGKKHLGIYELEGDNLKFCFAAPDKERPTDFTSKEGDGRTTSVWKREKKEEKAP